MHLAIDAVGNKQAGITTILLDTLAAAERNHKISKVTVFCSPRSVRSFDLPMSAKIVEIEEPGAEHWALRTLWYEWLLPRRVKTEAADVLLCFHSAGQSPNGIPHVTCIQRPLEYSAEAARLVTRTQRLRTAIIRHLAARSCRRAALVFVHTPTEKRNVARLSDIPDDRIRILLPNPRELSQEEPQSSELSPMRDTPAGRRMLFVGQLFAHKNVQLVIDSMSQIRRRLPGMTLFISGPRDSRIRTAPGVIYLGFLSDASLRRAFELATVLVMPSLHETIGLPMIEAMSIGTPVIAVDRPYAHDVCEDAALYFDPHDPSDLVDKVVELCADDVLSANLIGHGRRLVERRMAVKPYDQMIDATVAVGSARGANNPTSGTVGETDCAS